MHEVSLVHALFDETDRAIAPHPSAAVRQLKVRVGELAGVEGELFRTAFDGCRAERGYAAAQLELVFEPACWSCRTCGAKVAVGEVLHCADCGGDVALSAGASLFLDRVELELSDV
jgi:Zn finger protein HypA/HybF involved in hydrogenase expression